MGEQKNLEEYLSYVRHELYNRLLVLREGTSQVLDGLGNKDCAKCFKILNLVLNSADKMNGLIEKLISVSAFESVLDGQHKTKQK